ncbi:MULTISPECIES: hotdog fold thioesterase [Nocardioides]|uniref:Hotdog fold thioesterase n=1 Tax=Nocardioides vastitatis TaxID=2568655 RepID=A0ABW0ZCB3_9ACTN|nr:hotdog fold thioesterase [Nocardioides sp.]THI96380.1 hotdog fold thioesterase [Nocardioides sp.]
MTSTEDVAQFLTSNAGALNEKMGVEIVEMRPERVVATMPVEGNTQPYGLLHGGASVVLAETLGSIAAALNAGPGRFPVGIEINATHHRAATKGRVTGVATPLHLGRTMASFEITITDETDRRLCTSRITCALLERDPAPKA